MIQTFTQHYGDFPDSAIDTERADRIMLATLPRDVIEIESDLAETMWWDYRTLHPTVLTYYFVECYRRAYKRLFAVVRDPAALEGENPMQPFKQPFFKPYSAKERRALKLKADAAETALRNAGTAPMKPAAEAKAREAIAAAKRGMKPVAAPWFKARQVLDAIGARYEETIYAMLTRHSNFHAANIMQPTSFYSELGIRMAIEEWDIIKGRWTELPQLPEFKAGSPSPLRPPFEAWMREEYNQRAAERRAMFAERLQSAGYVADQDFFRPPV